jgi:hypothetical protein
LTPRKRRQRLDSIHQIAGQLRQSCDVPAPDLTSSILAQVDATRPFLDGRTRRMLWGGRIALGLSVAAVGLGVALTHRWAPETIELVSTRPAPLSNVVETVRSEAGVRLVEIRVAVDSAGRPVAAGGSASSVPDGGLLTLVSSAAVTPAAVVTRPCTFCGPMIPPAEAARRVPAVAIRPALEVTPALANSAVTPRFALLAFRARLTGEADAASHANASPAGGSGWVSASISAGRPVSRLVLDELAPLGAGPSAESALAPK